MKSFFLAPVKFSFWLGAIVLFNFIIYRFVLFLTPSANYPFLPFSLWPKGLLIGFRYDLAAASVFALVGFFIYFIPYKKIFTGIVLFLILQVMMIDWVNYQWTSFRIDSKLFPYFTDVSLFIGGAKDIAVPHFKLIIFLIVYCLLNYLILKKLKIKFTKYNIKGLLVGLIFILILVCNIRGYSSIPLKANDYLYLRAEQQNVVSRNPVFQFITEAAIYIKLNSAYSFSIISRTDNLRLRKFMGFETDKDYINPLEHRLNKCFKNKTLATLTRPNIVLVQVESLGHGVSQSLPFFNTLKKKSFSFDRFSAAGTMTFDGTWANLCAILPTYGRFQTALLNNNFQCIPDVTTKFGYTNYLFYAGNPDMDGLRAFSNKHNFDFVYEKASFPKEDQKLEFSIDDITYFQKVASVLKTAKEPFFTYVITLQSHPPGEMPRDFKWPEGQVDQSVFMYFDIALKRFFDSVEKEKFYNNTIFIITADHTPHSQSYVPHDDRKLGSTLWEYRVPLLIYIPGLNKKEEAVSHKFSSQIDISATIFDMADLEVPVKSWGNSLFCDDKKPVILFSRRLSYLTVIKDGKIMSSGYQRFDVNKLLQYDIDEPYGRALVDISDEKTSEQVKSDLEFLFNINRNFISNNYYWR